MATHDYVIDNGSGSTVRADINSALQAIVTVNSNNTEPSAVFDKMLWHDGTENALKQRNSSSFTGLRLFSPVIKNGLLDVNGADAIKFNPTATAVNQFTIANAAAGNAPTLSVTGTDTNINLTLTPKGSASVFVPAGTVTNPSISISTDSNTGIYFAGADTMGFVEGGTGYQMGYRNVPSAGASKTTGYTLQLSDIGKLITIGSGGGITVPNAVFAAGDIIYVYNDTSSAFTITRGTNAELYQSGVDANVATISVATRTMGAIQYVSSTRAVFFSGAQGSSSTFQLEYVIVGGGGGANQGGGGGGGYIAGLNAGTVDGINYGSQEKQGGDNVNAEKPISIKKGIAYSVAIGAGGAAGTSVNVPSARSGNNSYFSNLLAIGGGAGLVGQTYFSATTLALQELIPHTIGGCGGAMPFGGTNLRAFVRQGRLGGNGIQPNFNYGGNGGGGASGVGSSSPNSGAPTGYENGVAGGAGITTNILSSAESLSGGGGGGAGNTGTSGGTASHGGGAGGRYSPSATAGTNGSVNTGGGGGGQPYNLSTNGAGGSGVILLRFPTGITATSSGSPADLTMTTGTKTVDGVTFNTLKITAGVGTITFN
jgi:hypothetical protein